MTFSQWLLGRCKAPYILMALLTAALLGLTGPAAAQENFAGEAALTQADIEGYVYLAPRLIGPAAQDASAAAQLLAESGLTRRRALYVGAKIAVAQAMVTGALSAEQLAQGNTSPSLYPTAEELALVQQHLTTLTQVQIECLQAKRNYQRAVAGTPRP